MANSTNTSSPNQLTDEMLDAIIKTFIIQHVDDTDEHLAQTLVYNAGRLAWRMRETGLTTEKKTSVSDVVTAADRAAEKFIAEALRAIRPNDGLLGEEGAAAESKSGRTWVIDPVDGTYNFTISSDYWCAALALVEGPVEAPTRELLGAVHRPAMGYTWFGGVGHHTTRDGRPAPEFADVPADETVLATYLHPTDFLDANLRDAWVSVTGQFATVRMLGSASVDLANVAMGEIGCWMQHSLPAWDWLPGKALVEAAGGKADSIDAAGKTWFVAGSPKSVDAVITALSSL